MKTPTGVAEVAEHPLWESDEPVDIGTGVNPYLKVSHFLINNIQFIQI